MTVNCLKLRLAVRFMKYLASLLSLIFLAMDLAELMENESMKSICQKITKIPFSV